MISPHHLELFYYVAKHRGIGRAARQMPYGIQQPAISKQLLQLEDRLNLRLCERQPFSLTPAGRELYLKLESFFGFTGKIDDWAQAQRAPLVRIATSEFISNQYLPIVLQRFRRRVPTARVKLIDVPTPAMIPLLHDGEIDLAISAFGRPPRKLRTQSVVTLPLVLVVPKSLPRLRPEQYWTHSRIPRSLVCPPACEEVTRRFLATLRQQGRASGPVIELSSTALVTPVVATGEGIGVSLDLPDLVRHPRVRTVPLPGFPTVEVAVMWRDPVSPCVQAMIEQITQRQRELWPR